MNGGSNVLTGPATRPVRLWAMLLPTAVFFVLGHDLMRSTYENYGLTAETMAEDVLTGTLLRRVMLITLGAFGLALLYQDREARAHWSGGLGWAMVFLVTWAFASLTWSSNPVLTFRRLPVLGAMCIAALALGKRSPPQAIVRWILVSASLCVALGLTAEVYLGTFTPGSAAYRFSGTLHPNDQGQFCALLVLAGLTLRVGKRVSSVLKKLALAAVFGLLLLTKSRTAILGFFVAVSTFLWLPVARRHKNLLMATPFLIVACFSLAFLAQAFHPFPLSIIDFGREQGELDTLTGRIPLWEHLLGYVTQRPLLGSGYGAFWTADQLVEVSNKMDWMVGQAHSDYLEVALHLGVVGLFAYLLVLVGGLCRAVSLTMRSDDRFSLFAAAVLTFWIVHGFSESQVFSGSFPTFVYMTLLVSLSQMSLPERAAAPASRPADLRESLTYAGLPRG